MANPNQLQAIRLLQNARNILVFVPSGTDLDAVAAALSLKEYLGKLSQHVTIVAPSALSGKLAFLPGSESVRSGVLSKNLLIEISLGKTQVAELNYEKSEDKLAIFVTPKSGEFAVGDVSIKPAVYPFDLLVTIGVPTLTSLGKIFETHAQLFYQTPIINIDYTAANELFGQVNLVSLTSAANSEVVFDLFTEWDQNFIDETIATLLLSGLISETNSFQDKNVTPLTFEKASKLINLGARQQEIISQLYRAKSLGLLRLWGRVLARLKDDPSKQMVISMVNATDFEKSSAEVSDVDEIINEMVSQLSFAKTFVFLAEGVGVTTVYLVTMANLDLAYNFASYNPIPIANNGIKLTLTQPLSEAENTVLQILAKVA